MAADRSRLLVDRGSARRPNPNNYTSDTNNYTSDTESGLAKQVA